MAISLKNYKLNIKKNKKLISIYKDRNLTGLGKFSMSQILKIQGLTVFQKNIINISKPIKFINFGKQITKSIVVKLRKKRLYRINVLRRIACFKGMRHSKFLPVRGQRTKTNAKTRKHRKIY